MSVIYQHLRKDTRDVFYIGIGHDVSRAYKKSNRSVFWKSIVSKYDYIVDVICSNISHYEAIELEKYLIAFYGRVDNKTGILCNMTDGGEGGSLGIIQSEETRNKKRLSNYKRIYKKGYKHTEEAIIKISEASKGKTISEEVKKKISEKNKIILNSEEHKQRVSKQKSKEVIQYDIKGNYVNSYPSLTVAANTLMLQISKISSVCSGKRNSTGGFKWKYKINKNENKEDISTSQA